MTFDSLAEYLVKIGFDVDTRSFVAAKVSSGKVISTISKGLGRLGPKFTNFSSTAVSSLTTVVDSMFNLLNTTAKLDLATERYARRMWTTEKNARSFSTAMKALGMSERDFFYATEEEIKRFNELRELGNSFKEPKELEDTLVLIRDIQFEFSKLKVLFTYGSRMVSYYLNQYLGGELERIKEKLKSGTKWASKNLPKIAQAVAKVFEICYRLLTSAIIPIIEAVKWLINLWNSFSKNAKVGIGAIGTAIWLLKSGPLGWLIAALTSILLLVDDFMTWKRGGRSYFDWSSMEGIFDEIGESVSYLVEQVNTLFNMFERADGTNSLLETLKGLLESILGLLNNTIDALGIVFSWFNNFGKMINGEMSFSEWLKGGKERAAKIDKEKPSTWGGADAQAARMMGMSREEYNEYMKNEAEKIRKGEKTGRKEGSWLGEIERFFFKNRTPEDYIQAVSIPASAYRNSSVKNDNRDQRQTNNITINTNTMQTASEIAYTVANTLTNTRYVNRGAVI